MPRRNANVDRSRYQVADVLDRYQVAVARCRRLSATAVSVADFDSLLCVQDEMAMCRCQLDAAPRCPAAHPDDPTPCVGPVVVTVLDARNAGANGCEHHGARLLASLDGGRVYGLPHAEAGTAIRVFKAADAIRPFPWLTDAPRPAPNMLSLAENRRRGEQW